MFKQAILLLLITYALSEGMVNKSTYDNLKKTATYKVRDWKSNPFRKISKEQFYSKYASKQIPQSKPKFGQKISSIKRSDIPDYYDARDQYPKCVPVIKNMGDCGSSPAFAGVSALSFRFCMATEENVELSPQDLVACRFGHCRLGDLVQTWNYLEEFGAVSEKCFPFVSGNKTEFPDCLNQNKTCAVEG